MKHQNARTQKQQQQKKIHEDPVCGMDLTGAKDAPHFTHRERSFSFCDENCKKRFQEHPSRYLKQPLFQLRNIWKTFDMGEVQTKVLQGLNLNIWEGDFVAIIGASGSGKSTLLNMLGLLDRPSSGTIQIQGKDASELSDEERASLRSNLFGFVFQQFNLIPWLSAYENITLPLIFSQKPIDEKKLMKQIELAGFTHRIHHRPTQLSGGEQQRTALLRALANNPHIILGDEPTGNLDSKTGSMILDLLIEQHKKEKKTLIIVTHDLHIAKKANQIIAVQDGQVVRDHKLLG